MNVPLVDLKAQFATIRDEVLPAIEEVLASAQLFLGPNTGVFEAEYAAFCGTRYCAALSNCTDALRHRLAHLHRHLEAVVQAAAACKRPRRGDSLSHSRALAAGV